MALTPWLKRIDAARWYTNHGPLAQAFEASLAQSWAGEPRPQVVCLCSGTATLELGVAALALPVGANALLPAFAFPAAAAAALGNRLAPVLAYAPALAAVPGLSLQQGVKPGALPAVCAGRAFAHTGAGGCGRPCAGGLQTRRWYCPPAHHHPAFACCARCGPNGNADLPVTEHLAEHTLGLPWFSGMTHAQCAEVVAELGRALAGDGNENNCSTEIACHD